MLLQLPQTSYTLSHSSLPLTLRLFPAEIFLSLKFLITLFSDNVSLVINCTEREREGEREKVTEQTTITRHHNVSRCFGCEEDGNHFAQREK